MKNNISHDNIPLTDDDINSLIDFISQNDVFTKNGSTIFSPKEYEKSLKIVIKKLNKQLHNIFSLHICDTDSPTEHNIPLFIYIIPNEIRNVPLSVRIFDE